MDTQPEHFIAAAEMLELYARRLREGISPEKLGREVELLGRVIARRVAPPLLTNAEIKRIVQLNNALEAPDYALDSSLC